MTPTKTRRLFAAGRIPAKRASVDRLVALAAIVGDAGIKITIYPLPKAPQVAA